ncbi:glycosyl transferase 2 family protein, partial [Vibrio parahaemolyticus VPTS-2010_2]
QPIKKFYE